MATGEDNNKGKEGKGFAGLSSLVSEIETPQSPVTKKEPPAAASAAPGVARPAWQSAQPTPPPSTPPPYRAPAPPSSDSSAGKWLLGIAAVIGWLWVMGESNKKPASPAPAYAPTAQAPALPTPSPTISAPPQALSRPEETKPPVGQDLVLSVGQIRYCLAEDIRMEGAKSVLNNYSDSDVDSFNAMVSDYNSRCGSFRYRRGVLEGARRDIEAYRSQLQSDGKGRYERSPSTGKPSAPASSRPAPDATVLEIQRKLNEFGYDAGTVDGLMGRGTRSAILAFQRDNGLPADGHPTLALLQLLSAERQAAAHVETLPTQTAAPAIAPPTFAKRREKEKQDAAAAQVEATRVADENRKAEAARIAEERRRADAHRFLANGDGTVTDSETGLLWEDNDNSRDFSWGNARKYCAGKGEGWQVPTVAQLLGLYDASGNYKQSCGVGECNVTPLIHLSNWWFWSNEASGSSEAWGVSFAGGARSLGVVGEKHTARALCVRPAY